MKFAAPLSGLRILITRPSFQAENLMFALKDAGATVMHFPVTDIIPTINCPSVMTALAYYETAISYIFTSKNAVDNAICALKQAGKLWPPTATVFAVGPTTREALIISGCENVIIPDQQFNSEGLLARAELQHIKNQTILIFGGENPRPLLANTLQQRGANVFHAACYRRAPLFTNISIAEQATLLHDIDVIVCTSHETLINLFEVFDSNLHNVLFDKEFLVINLSMQSFLAKLGYIKSPILADNPTDSSIMTALTRWYKEDRHD